MGFSCLRVTADTTSTLPPATRPLFDELIVVPIQVDRSAANILHALKEERRGKYRWAEIGSHRRRFRPARGGS